MPELEQRYLYDLCFAGLCPQMSVTSPLTHHLHSATSLSTYSAIVVKSDIIVFGIKTKVVLRFSRRNIE